MIPATLLRLPPPSRLARDPELAVLAILDAAIDASEFALSSVHPVFLQRGSLRGSPLHSAKAIVLHGKRLAAEIAGYRNAIERERRRNSDEPF